MDALPVLQTLQVQRAGNPTAPEENTTWVTWMSSRLATAARLDIGSQWLACQDATAALLACSNQMKGSTAATTAPQGGSKQNEDQSNVRVVIPVKRESSAQQTALERLPVQLASARAVMLVNSVQKAKLRALSALKGAFSPPLATSLAISAPQASFKTNKDLQPALAALRVKQPPIR